MDNLANEIAHISKILEKEIPKGYHQLVVEYVRQSIAGVIIWSLVIGVCVTLAILLAKFWINSSKNKEKSFVYDAEQWRSTVEYELNLAGFVMAFLSAAFMVFVAITVSSSVGNIQTDIQQALAPNYYLIKSFL